jgi:hypothetical protein
MCTVLNKRLYPRFSCEREVDVAYFLEGRRCGVHKAVVCDISERGLRLRLPEPAPSCDRALIRTGRLVIPYVIRSRSVEEGACYAGAELLGTVGIQ